MDHVSGMKQNDKTLKNDGSWLIKKRIFFGTPENEFFSYFCGCLDDMKFLVKINNKKFL